VAGISIRNYLNITYMSSYYKKKKKWGRNGRNGVVSPEVDTHQYFTDKFNNKIGTAPFSLQIK